MKFEIGILPPSSHYFQRNIQRVLILADRSGHVVLNGSSHSCVSVSLVISQIPGWISEFCVSSCDSEGEIGMGFTSVPIKFIWFAKEIEVESGLGRRLIGLGVIAGSVLNSG